MKRAPNHQHDALAQYPLPRPNTVAGQSRAECLSCPRPEQREQRMPADVDDPEFLATYGRWDFDVFLSCLKSEDAVVVLVTVDTDERTDEAREYTNDLVHQIWNAAISVFPRCAGHRLSWSWLIFLFSKRDAEPARAVLAGQRSASASHSISHWFAEAGELPAERTTAIRSLEDARERDRARGRA
jgi:hypothetical protein